jgi:truncated hemoglobin YjbI
MRKGPGSVYDKLIKEKTVKRIFIQRLYSFVYSSSQLSKLFSILRYCVHLKNMKKIGVIVLSGQTFNMFIFTNRLIDKMTDTFYRKRVLSHIVAEEMCQSIQSQNKLEVKH